MGQVLYAVKNEEIYMALFKILCHFALCLKIKLQHVSMSQVGHIQIAP